MTAGPDEHDSDCPACGGSGGGPFGRPGSAWDVEDYVCPRCRGLGMLAAATDDARVERPGIVKTAPPPAVPADKNRRANAS